MHGVKLAAGCSLIMALIAGCGGGPGVTRSVQLSQTLMYPLVDLRDKNETSIESCDRNQPVGNKDFLMALGSRLQFASDLGLTLSATEEDFSQPNRERLRNIANKGHDYVAAVFLRHFDYNFGSFKYVVQAYVVRADQGTVVWTNSVNDSVWLGLIQGPADQLAGTVRLVPKCVFLESVVAKTFVKMPKLPPYLPLPPTPLPSGPKNTTQ